MPNDSSSRQPLVVCPAMLECLPQLRGGCINYWEAGNWSLHHAAEPVGRKSTRDHRRVVNLRTELTPFYTALGFEVAGTAPLTTHVLKRDAHFVLMSKQLTGLDIRSSRPRPTARRE